MENLQDLDILIANDPEAYHFDALSSLGKNPEQSAVSEELTEAFQSVAALCGVDIHLRNQFYARPRKLRQEKLVLSAERKFIEGDEEAALDILEETVLSLLWVRTGEETLRPAESADLQDEFDSKELMAILTGAMGVRFEDIDTPGESTTL